MILDGLIILIILIAAVVGYKCGLASTIAKLGSWLAAVVLAFAFSGPLKKFLAEKTQIDDDFHEKFVTQLSGNKSADSLDAVPGLFQDQFTQAKTNFVNATASNLTDIVMAVFAFVIILVGVKLIAIAFNYLFSKKHSKGIVGFTDGMLGLAAGLVTGIIIVLALMAFAVPFAVSSSSDFAELFASASKDGVISPYFYDYNLFLLFIKDFII